MSGFDAVSPLRINREIGQGCQIFRLHGIFDVFSVPTFRWGLEKYVGATPENFILDLADIDLIDRSALDALTDLGKNVQRHGGTLQAVGSPRIARVIRLGCPEQFLSLQPSLDAAIHSIRPTGISGN